MDENLQNLIPSSSSSSLASDRADQNGTTTRSDMSDLTRNDSRNSVEDSETASTGVQMTWTEEKHRLYISSMEASFVKQLHNLERRSLNMLDWSSRGNNKMNLSSSRQLDASTHTSSGQFKVLRRGCWESIKFERAQPRADVADETHALPKNIWIQHFRSGRKNQERSPKLQQNAESHGVAKSSKHHSDLCSDLYRQDSVGSNTEVSDQNFGNEDQEGEQLSRAKRMKTAAFDESDNDQVVPMANAPMTFDLNEKYTSPEEEEVGTMEEVGTISGGSLENMDDFGCLKPGTSYYIERELRERDCHAKELKLMDMHSS